MLCEQGIVISDWFLWYTVVFCWLLRFGGDGEVGARGEEN